MVRAGVEGPLFVRHRDEIDDTVRQVCQACNHGWSHDLERAFRALMLPALRGTGPVVLGRGGQQVVAAWAVKLWLLAEIANAHLRGGQIDAFGVFRTLRKDMAPPDHTQVWIGAHLSNDDTVTWLSSQTVVNRDRVPLGYLGALAVGRLFLLVFGPALLPEEIEGRYIVPQTKALLQVWPHEIEKVRWPPPVILSTSDLERLWPSGEVVVIP